MRYASKPGFPSATMRSSAVVVALVSATALAAPTAAKPDPLDAKPAPCRLSASGPKPLPPSLAHVVRANSDDVRPHQSLVVTVDGATRVIDPADPRRVVAVPDDVREAMLLPSRLVAVRDRRELTTGTASLRKGEMIGAIDAVAAGRDTFVAGIGDGRTLFVDRIDGVGKLAAHHATREPAFAVRIVRTRAGALAVAWLARERDGTALEMAWLDADGTPGKPLRVDAIPGEQPFSNLAIAPHRDGIVVAWNPISGTPEGERVPIEIRVFHADAGGVPSLLRRVSASSMSWTVAGSAGGVLPNFMQALPFSRNAAIIWWAFDKNRGELRGVPVDGGAPLVLMPDLRGQPIARSDGKSATVLLEAREGEHQLVTLRCE